MSIAMVCAAAMVRLRVALLGLVTLATTVAASDISALRRAANCRSGVDAGAAVMDWSRAGSTGGFGQRRSRESQPLGKEAAGLLARLIAQPQTRQQVLQSLALGDRTIGVAESLARARRLQLAAGLIVATDAVIRDRFAAAREGMAEPEPDPDATTSYVQPWRDLPEIDDGDRERLVAVLVRLLGSRDADVRAAAAIAAAYYGFDDPALQTAMAALEDERGPTPGAQLLYCVRSGGEVAPGLVARAMEAGRQPRSIERADLALVQHNVIIPSQAMAAEALGLAGASEHLERLHTALTHEDLRVRFEAARACGRLGRAESALPLVRALDGAAWPVFVEITLALTRCRHADAIPEMMELLKGLGGRFRQHLLYALSATAGNQYGRITYDQWYDWWVDAQADFAIDDAASERYLADYAVADVSMDTEARFYDLPVVSTRLLFVVDRSGSMSGERIASLKTNMRETLVALTPGSVFNIIAYDDRIDQFARQMTNRRDLGVQYVQRLSARGGTNIYDSGYAGLMEPGLDSLFLLTDGSPGSGQFTDWLHITASFLFLNRYRPIPIHTVAFEAGVSTARSMKQLSLMSGGGHMHFE